MLGDSSKIINFPEKVIALPKANIMFGIPSGIFTRDYKKKCYYIIENSGIIRSGFTFTFYVKNPTYFKMFVDTNIVGDNFYMPYGKYAGIRLIDIPDDYWLIFRRTKWYKTRLSKLDQELINYANKRKDQIDGSIHNPL